MHLPGARNPPVVSLTQLEINVLRLAAVHDVLIASARRRSPIATATVVARRAIKRLAPGSSTIDTHPAGDVREGITIDMTQVQPDCTRTINDILDLVDLDAAFGPSDLDADSAVVSSRDFFHLILIMPVGRVGTSKRGCAYPSF